MVKKFADKDKAYFSRDLVCTDSNEVIVDTLVEHALRKGLRLNPERFSQMRSYGGGTIKSI